MAAILISRATREENHERTPGVTYLSERELSRMMETRVQLARETEPRKRFARYSASIPSLYLFPSISFETIEEPARRAGSSDDGFVCRSNRERCLSNGSRGTGRGKVDENWRNRKEDRRKERGESVYIDRSGRKDGIKRGGINSREWN